MTAAACLARRAAATGLLLGGGPLLTRMAREQRHDSGFSTTTAAGVWTAWAAWAGLLADAALTDRQPRRPAVHVLGLGGATVGAGFFAAGAGAFPSSGQLTGTETTDLVTDGPYRLSRNPQYLGAVLLGAGTTTATGSRRAALLTAGLAVVLHRWIDVEEEVLAQRFGPTWDAYRGRTGRWWTA